MTAVRIRLERYEWTLAAQVGVRRRVASMALDNRVAQAQNDWNVDVMGAGAEMAVAKALQVYWDGSVGTFKTPDVGTLQVRSTHHHKNGHLILRPRDDVKHVYVFVTYLPDEFWFDIHGYITGQDVRALGIHVREKPEYWKADRSLLEPFNDLM